MLPSSGIPDLRRSNVSAREYGGLFAFDEGCGSRISRAPFRLARGEPVGEFQTVAVCSEMTAWRMWQRISLRSPA